MTKLPTVSKNNNDLTNDELDYLVLLLQKDENTLLYEKVSMGEMNFRLMKQLEELKEDE